VSNDAANDDDGGEEEEDGDGTGILVGTNGLAGRVRFPNREFSLSRISSAPLAPGQDTLALTLTLTGEAFGDPAKSRSK